MEPNLLLTAHLNGLIMFAKVSWLHAGGNHAQAARMLQRVARIQRAAIRDGQVGRLMDLRVKDEDILG
ncbi:hypothetical protein N825_28930 [Skermanella stibiiresistens SB22]|uniref:Uncharacterized protein n=1 Tax=Skermanella stibiiresistens SB22 TaxID=1385369 RepID=W9GRC1_9PROT|nr:hypothetical protein [Skermanella stibiiresistens]EWY36299.1 hypothetical protein N825_28930 [Skermanella stibiiresistens SB22]